MSETKFGYGEMISHGWEVFKKFWSTILLMAIIYGAVNAIDFMMAHYSGERVVSKADTGKIIDDPNLRDKLFVDLYGNGIIDKIGLVDQDRLSTIKAVEDLHLSPELEPSRDKIFQWLVKYRYRLPFPKPVYYLLRILFWVVAMVMGIGSLGMTIKMSRGEKPFLSEMFTRWDVFVPYLLGALCYGLAVIGGTILLIIPGIIVSFMLGMYTYLIVDKGYGPIAALKRSRVITKGSRMRLFIFCLLLGLLNLAGLLCLIVGVFVTMAVGSLAMAKVYDRLENTPEVTVQ